VLNNRIHHNGIDATQDSGVFSAANDVTIDGNDIYSNKDYGLFINCPGCQTLRNTVRNNRIHGNLRGMIVGTGDNDIVYNNLVYQNGTGIQVENGGANTQVYNNTIWQNTLAGAEGQCGFTTNTGDTWKNNICYQNPTDNIVS